MQRLGGNLVLGLIVLVIGASLAIGLALDVQRTLPLVRLAIAAVCVALGARMVVHAFRA